MPDTAAGILGWVIPAVVVFGLTAIAIAVIAWAIRSARRSPRARAAADALRAKAGGVLVQLDDAVDELDLEVGLSGALYGGGAPTSLRRARLTAQHVRDDSFDEYRAICEPDAAPADIRRVSARIERRSTEALAVIAAARAEHADWVRANVSAAGQVDAARARLAALRESMGDPRALVAELSARYAEEEWVDADAAARAAVEHADKAEKALDAAAARAADPTATALPELAAAERELRRAEAEARTLEETHRLVTQAAQAVTGELDAARTAMRQAAATREQLEPSDSERLGAELRLVQADLGEIEIDAARRPTRTIERIARLRGRLDLAHRAPRNPRRSTQQRRPGGVGAHARPIRGGRPRPAGLRAARARGGAAERGPRRGAGCRPAGDARRGRRPGPRRLRQAGRALTRRPRRGSRIPRRPRLGIRSPLS